MVDSWTVDRLTAFGKGHAQKFEQVHRFFVGSGSGDDGNVHALLPFDLIELDFRKNGLVAHAQRIIAAPVKGASGEAAKIANARQGGGDEPVKKFIHGIAAQSNAAADGLALAQLEVGDAMARFADSGLATGDQSEVFGGVIDGALFE